jgi:hypothetical protein
MARYGVPISRVTSGRDSGMFFLNAIEMPGDKSDFGVRVKNGNGERIT